MAAHNETGKEGEAMAMAELIHKGYKILATNWRFARTEVDIIARIGDTLVLVEVKTRQTELFGFPEEFVTKKKEEQMSQAAEAYCQMHPGVEWEVRYDVISVIIDGNRQEVEHFEDAFFPDNLGR